MNAQQLLNDIYEKYGEWIEEAGLDGPLLMNQILAKMVLIERDKNEYYEKRIKNETECSTGLRRLAHTKKVSHNCDRCSDNFASKPMENPLSALVKQDWRGS
jgi:hypothetical protein